MIKNRIIISSFIIFFCSAFYFIVSEIKHDCILYRNFYRASDDEKRESLIDNLYEFIEKCKKNIPENAAVLVLTDNPGESLLLSYHLYPRKLYFYNHKPIRQYPVSIEDLDPEFLKNKKIKWVVSRFSKKCAENMIIQL